MNTGPAQIILDTDVKSHQLPLLEQRIEVFASAARAAGSEPSVHLHVDPGATQQRVVDVLNVLAQNKIERVTFANQSNDK